MTLERKGKQYRVRVCAPSDFQKETLRNKDVGKHGGLQLIVGRRKGRKETNTQAIRVSTRDFKRIGNKLVPKSSRGLHELTTLRKRKTGKLAEAVKKYF